MDDFLVPQANRLAHIVAVVDSVADNCTTAKEVAAALGMSDRQGAYYPHAAAVLGLVSVVDTTPMSWQLTPLGAEFVGLDAQTRTTRLADLVMDLDYVQTYCEADGESLLRDAWSGTLGEETISRRLTTIAAWTAFVSGSQAEQAEEVSLAMTGTRERTPGVLAERKQRLATKLPTQKVCRDCHLAVPRAFEQCPDCN